MVKVAGQGKKIEETVTFANGVSLLAGNEMTAEQESLVRAVVSGEMTVEEAIAIAKAQVK